MQALFEARYANEYFVDVMPAKSHPETRFRYALPTCAASPCIVWGSLAGDNTVVVLSVIDNLVKGASGQLSVRVMNILFGLDERSGS